MKYFFIPLLFLFVTACTLVDNDNTIMPELIDIDDDSTSDEELSDPGLDVFGEEDLGDLPELPSP